MQKKGKTIKKRPEDETEERSLGKELEEFKKMVRFITGSSGFKTKAAFTHDQRANRLKGLAVYGHNPAIRAIPCIPVELHMETYLAILQQKTGYKTVHGKRAKKMLEGEAQEPIIMKPRRLNFKKPPQWRRSRRELPEYNGGGTRGRWRRRGPRRWKGPKGSRERKG